MKRRIKAGLWGIRLIMLPFIRILQAEDLKRKVAQLPKSSVILLLIIISLTSLISAELIISQPQSIYNFGDSFDISVKIVPQRDTRDFFTASLFCSEQEVELYKSPFKIITGEEKEVQISTVLDKFVASNTGGKCYLKAKFGDESSSSQTFELVRYVKVSANLGDFSYFPGKEINVNGEAKKTNSKSLNGFVELSIPQLEIILIRPVTAGKFSFNFTTPYNTKSSTYSVEIKAYEKDSSGEIVNEGSTTSSIKIRQVPKELGVALSSQTIMPNNQLLFTPVIYDQAGGKIDSEVSLVVYKPDNTVFKKNLVRSDIPNPIFIESNYTPGTWRIEASSSGLQKTKEFVVEEYRNLSFSLENNTLTVKNLGNVPFKGPIEVSIGRINEIKDIALGVGSSKKFRLLAPDGDYNIKIGDGSAQYDLGSSFLTGKAISVDDSFGNSASSNILIIIWLVVIIIIAAIAVILYRKISRKTFIGKSPSTLSSTRLSDSNSSTQTAKTISQLGPQLTTNIIDKGEKQESSMIALKLKNLQELKTNQEAINLIETALYKAKGMGGKVYTEGDYRLIVLAPMLTKEADNSQKAVNIATQMEKVIIEYNSKALKKIDYGFGVTDGSLIVENKDGKFRFVSADNSIISAKNIAQFSNNDILISESIHRKTTGKTRANKLSDKNFWQIERVVDRTQHEDFINRFKNRNKQ